MAEARHSSELQAEISPQAQKTPRQVIFESCTSLWTCSTWKHTALISYPYEPSTVQHCQLMIHSPENKTMCPTRSQIMQESQHPVNFLAKIYIFLFSSQCFICFCSSDHKTNPPGLFRQQQHALPEDVLPQRAIVDFPCTFPGALLYSKLSCSLNCSAAHPQPLTFCTSSLASSWTYTSWLIVRVSKQQLNTGWASAASSESGFSGSTLIRG